MKIYTENNLRDFEFWSGAVDTVKYLTKEELDAIETIFEDMYPDGMDETQINDIFWFEDDWIAEMLGYNDFEEIMYRNEEEEEEEEENGLPEEANKEYDTISNQTICYDSFEEFCKHNEFGLSDCQNCVMGCLKSDEDCEAVFNRFKELEG